MLVLLCGSGVLDESKPVVQQVEGEEITYVVKQVGAGQAAISLMHALAPGVRNSPLPPAEASALSAVVPA